MTSHKLRDTHTMGLYGCRLGDIRQLATRAFNTSCCCCHYGRRRRRTTYSQQQTGDCLSNELVQTQQELMGVRGFTI